MVAMAGMDAVYWLRCGDPFERNVIQRVAERRAILASEERQDLAGRIINLLGKSLKVK
jgi:hypothetical protein